MYWTNAALPLIWTLTPAQRSRDGVVDQIRRGKETGGSGEICSVDADPGSGRDSCRSADRVHHAASAHCGGACRRSLQGRAQRDRRLVSGIHVPGQCRQHPFLIRDAVDHIGAVGGISRGRPRIRRGRHYGVVDRIVKKDLSNKITENGRSRVSSHSYVNVDGAAAVPAWINGCEFHLAILIGDLISAQKPLPGRVNRACAASRIVGPLIGVDAFGIAVPDVHVSTRQQRAGGTAQILDGDREGKRNPAPRRARCRVGPDIGTEEFLVHPIRAFRYRRSSRYTSQCIRRFHRLVPRRNKEGGAAGPSKRSQRRPAAQKLFVHDFTFTDSSPFPGVISRIYAPDCYWKTLTL